MKLEKFQKMIKSRITEAALNCLTGKQRTKGGEIKYEELQMSEYLSPNNTGLTIKHKRNMFSVLNRMVNISANFPSNSKIDNCICNDDQNMQNIYSCQLLNKESEQLSYSYCHNLV